MLAPESGATGSGSPENCWTPGTCFWCVLVAVLQPESRAGSREDLVATPFGLDGTLFTFTFTSVFYTVQRRPSAPPGRAPPPAMRSPRPCAPPAKRAPQAHCISQAAFQLVLKMHQWVCTRTLSTLSATDHHHQSKVRRFIECCPGTILFYPVPVNCTTVVMNVWSACTQLFPSCVCVCI